MTEFLASDASFGIGLIIALFAFTLLIIAFDQWDHTDL